jgi:DNA invertase Pin-like site-specific DNA recombinase
MPGAQALDASNATGWLMLSVIAAVGQAGRESMLERQRDGIAKAKRDGRYKGRVPTARRQAAEIARLKAESLRPSEIAIRLGIGRAIVYRVLSGGGDRVPSINRVTIADHKVQPMTLKPTATATPIGIQDMAL